MYAKEHVLGTLFTETVSENKTAMFRLAYSMLRNKEDAEDAVAEAVLKAYSHLQSLRNPKKMKSWLFQILVNESKALLKRRSRIQLVEDCSKFMEEDAGEQPYDLLEFVYRLEDGFKEVILLYYFEEFRVKEIAKILGISEGTVKSRLSRGRAAIRRFMENEQPAR